MRPITPSELRRSRLRPGAVLAGMRIRKKLVFLHTGFSLVLAGILAMALRPAVREVVAQAELHEAQTIAQLVLPRLGAVPAGSDAPRISYPDTVDCRVGTASQAGLTETEAARVREARGGVVILRDDAGENALGPRVAAFDPLSGRYVAVAAKLEGARRAVVRLYVAMMLALLAVYALVAAALEIFVLPEHVYEPIRRLLGADLAVQEGRRDDELIPESAIPRDELGEIMRSRNESIVAMRKHERDLDAALRRIEEVATDLKKKNHLLEAARRNLADADRLASLGVMSAGLAHEMNTPLAVLKGMVEKLQRSLGERAHEGEMTPADAELMARVVSRLERLSESLLDFARVRPAQARPASMRSLVDEAWTLVSLDREAGAVECINRVGGTVVVECDADRIVQVLVNLLRNAVDVMNESELFLVGGAPGRQRQGAGGPRIEVDAGVVERDGRRWASLTITDNGPGIDPEVLPRLFEPFASTRLDSRGTGLGLAVSEGIVSEHGGLVLARNRREGSGAVFEVLLPMRSDPPHPPPPPADRTVRVDSGPTRSV